ncbi:MAG: CsbD family protein [Thalassobaculum sp.]
MNWDQIEGNWKSLKGKAQAQWGELTDDDLDQTEGRQEELEGLIQQRYGKSREDAKQALKDWADKL